MKLVPVKNTAEAVAVAAAGVALVVAVAVAEQAVVETAAGAVSSRAVRNSRARFRRLRGDRAARVVGWLRW